MAEFLGQRIIEGYLDYTLAVTKRPDLKSGIDVYLNNKGRQDLIVN